MATVMGMVIDVCVVLCGESDEARLNTTRCISLTSAKSIYAILVHRPISASRLPLNATSMSTQQIHLLRISLLSFPKHLFVNLHDRYRLLGLRTRMPSHP